MSIAAYLKCEKCQGDNTLVQWSTGKVSLTVYCRDCCVGRTKRILKRDRKAVDDKLAKRFQDECPF